jgi:hypothetical protein
MRVKFPLPEGARELILDVCKHLLSKSGSYRMDEIDATIAELLSYLPEVQFLGSKLQEVSIDGHHYTFMRKKPSHCLFAALARAERFDSQECEVMLMRYRFQTKVETAS